MQQSRFLGVAAVLAALGPWPAASAGPGRVVAYGHRVDHGCHFDDEVVQPTGTVVWTDAACRLWLAAAPDAMSAGRTLPAGPTMMPKTMVDSDANGVGGIEVGSVHVTHVSDGALRLAGSAANDATADHQYEVLAIQDFYNELDQAMYHEEMRFTYRQSAQDGSISAVAPEQGYCATNPGTTPHQPTVSSCWWRPGFLGGSTFSFESGAAFSDHVLLVPYDERRTAANFVTDTSGDVVIAHCSSTPESLPVGWSAWCSVTRDDVTHEDSR